MRSITTHKQNIAMTLKFNIARRQPTSLDQPRLVKLFGAHAQVSLTIFSYCSIMCGYLLIVNNQLPTQAMWSMLACGQVSTRDCHNSSSAIGGGTKS